MSVLFGRETYFTLLLVSYSFIHLFIHSANLLEIFPIPGVGVEGGSCGCDKKVKVRHGLSHHGTHFLSTFPFS